MSNDAVAQVKLDDFENIFSLAGKVAVVTGGSRGLGLHTASGLGHLTPFNFVLLPTKG